MKKLILIISLLTVGLGFQAQSAEDEMITTDLGLNVQPICSAVYNHLNAMKQCPDPDPKKCVDFQAVLTFQPFQDDKTGNCNIYASTTNWNKAFQKEKFYGVPKEGPRKAMPLLPYWKGDAYHFIYDVWEDAIYEKTGLSKFLSYERFEIDYSTLTQPLPFTKKVYFSSITLSGESDGAVVEEEDGTVEEAENETTKGEEGSEEGGLPAETEPAGLESVFNQEANQPSGGLSGCMNLGPYTSYHFGFGWFALLGLLFATLRHNK